MAFEFRPDGQFLLREQTPLERLVMSAVYSALEQGMIPSAPATAELDGKTVYLLAPDSAQSMLSGIVTAVLRKVREAEQEQQEAEESAPMAGERQKRGRYRTQSRVCLRCGQSYLARVVREMITCPLCTASSWFLRESGQRSAQLLCEQCGQPFVKEFDVSRDHRARYVSTVAREIEDRSRFVEEKRAQERKKELIGEGKTWTFPRKMPPEDNGDWENGVPRPHPTDDIE